MAFPPAFCQPSRAVTQRYARLRYLEAPPPVINIDTGRQLFVDDFLVAQFAGDIACGTLPRI